MALSLSSYNRVSSGIKTKLSQLFDSKSSSCSSSFFVISFQRLLHLLLKLVLNDKWIIAFKTNHLALIILNWMLILGNQANFWARAWPKMAVCLQLFLYCDLALVSDLYFPKKAPKSVKRTVRALLSLFYLFWWTSSYFYQIQNIQALHVLLDRFYLDSTNAYSTNVNMPQPRQLICLWNKNGFPIEIFSA